LTVDADGRSGRRCGTTGRSSDDHEGTVRRTIEFSMRNVTSLTFAGPAFTTAFVTTAAQGSDEDDETADALFRLEPGVEGIAEFRSKMSV
jgi:sugar lactone lactonase YvrE